MQSVNSCKIVKLCQNSTYFGLLNSKIDKRISMPLTSDDSAFTLSRSDRIVSISSDRTSSLETKKFNVSQLYSKSDGRRFEHYFLIQLDFELESTGVPECWGTSII